MSNHEHPGITRRTALQRGLAGAAALALCGSRDLLAQTEPQKKRAKAVIQVWLWGGPSHLDTFDPKPEAGSDYCGPFTNAIATNVDGVRIGELLPQLAQQADKYSLIRSLTHGVNAHETAAYLVQTGRQPDRLVYPGVGAVVGLLRGYDHGYKGVVPPYIVLTKPQGRFSEAGFLGPRHKPFATGGDPAQARFAVEGIIAQGVSDERQRRRRALLKGLDTLGRALTQEPQFQHFEACGREADELIFGAARKLFDLNEEPAALRDRYGRNTLGQSCLAARRLVEAGVPYVTINAPGWDTHKQHFQAMRRKLPELDQGLATLLADLDERGLLDQTIVWCCGEFGRTPRVQWEPPWNGGRGHFGACFAALVAGGGFKGGRVVGASDATGERVTERPVYPRDLIGSIYALLGIDPERRLPNARGLDVPLLPPPDEKEERSGPLREIMLA